MQFDMAILSIIACKRFSNAQFFLLGSSKIHYHKLRFLVLFIWCTLHSRAVGTCACSACEHNAIDSHSSLFELLCISISQIYLRTFLCPSKSLILLGRLVTIKFSTSNRGMGWGWNKVTKYYTVTMV